MSQDIEDTVNPEFSVQSTFSHNGRVTIFGRETGALHQKRLMERFGAVQSANAIHAVRSAS